MAGHGQTLHDRLNAARHTITGQSLARGVCKATTEELIGPKKKHLDYLIQCTKEPNVSVPELCNMLIERTQQSSWVIVFKSLITAHHLMCYGSEKFIQCMATTSCSFQLSSFVDKSGSQGYEMSTFIRRYAKYLNVKASTYRTMGSDFCKMKRGKDEGVLRNMITETLLKTLPILQEQMDALIEFDCNPDDLSNGVMNSCFVLLYRDLIQLFAAYNDGIINLFEKYFNMNKKHCKEALDIYKKFIVAMDKVSDFLKVAESVGIDKGNIPDLTKAPASLLEEMENHLTYLEGKKSHSVSAMSRANSVKNAVSALNSTSTAFSDSIDSSAHELNGLTIDESMRRAVEEEAAIMNQLKSDDTSLSPNFWETTEQRLRELANQRVPPGETTPPAAKVTVSSPSVPVPSPLPPPSGASVVSPVGKQKQVSQPSVVSSDGEDLLLVMSSNPPNSSASISMPMPTQPQPFQQVPFNQFGYEVQNTGTAGAASTFASEASFKSAFSGSVAPESSASLFGDVLQPQSSISPVSASPVPEECESKSSPTGSSKLISSDLDSSLKTLVQNLDINGPKKALKPSGHQWSSPKPATRTGGANWSPSSTVMTNWATPPGMQPMAMGPVPFVTPPIANTTPYGFQPTVPTMVAQQPYRMSPPVWPSAAFGVNQPQQQPSHQPVIQGGGPPVNQSTFDPFGAL